MNREQQYEANKAYIEAEGLDKIIPFFSQDTSATGQTPIAPQAEELVRLHKLIRSRKCFTAIEFGVGFSTVVMVMHCIKISKTGKTRGRLKRYVTDFCSSYFQWMPVSNG